MSAKTKVVGICIAALCSVGTAQTIDEITELNRQAAIAEAKGRIAAAKRVEGGAAPSAPGGAPGMPAGSAVPDAAPARAAPAWKARASKKERSSPPVLVAIYGVGGNLMVELSEAGFEGKYREGDKTPGGWTISRIDRRQVSVTKYGSGKQEKTEYASLPFGAKTEVPKEAASAMREQAPGNFSMPPLPPSFSAGR